MATIRIAKVLNMRNQFISLSLVFGALASVASGQTMPSSGTDFDPLVPELSSSDPVRQEAALTAVRHAIDTDPYNAVRSMRKSWLPALWQAQALDPIADLSLRAILAKPTSTWYDAYLMQNRVTALLRAGKSEQALSEAKGLFNIVPLKDSGSAMLLLVDCLTAARPNQPEVVDLFKKEQAAGAGTSDASPSTVLASIKVDPAVYLAAIKKLSPEDDRYHTGQCNLLLLADRPTDARKILEQGLATAKSPKAKYYSTLDVARAMKAEDGTVGRANAWLKANQPVADVTEPGPDAK